MDDEREEEQGNACDWCKILIHPLLLDLVKISPYGEVYTGIACGERVARRGFLFAS
jgi:hypothetical protein